MPIVGPSAKAVDLQNVKTNLSWSGWKTLSPTSLPPTTEQGVYILRSNQPIGRLRGESDVLYVGITKSHKDGLKNRIENHAIASNAENVHPSSASRYLATDLMQQIGIQVEYSCAVVHGKEDRNIIERDLLKFYREHHIELPPGNACMPEGGYEPLSLRP